MAHYHQTLPDGSRYEGEFEAGLPHGTGAKVGADGSRYEGEWAAGVYHGTGTEVFASGQRYEGEWAAGKPHGRGTQTLPDGRRREGEWRHGVPCGVEIEAPRVVPSASPAAAAQEEVRKPAPPHCRPPHSGSQRVSSGRAPRNLGNWF